MKISGIVFIIGFGVLTLGLGYRGFTSQSLPLTKNKNLTGLPARVVGVVCMLIGAAFLCFPLIIIILAIGERRDTQLDPLPITQTITPQESQMLEAENAKKAEEQSQEWARKFEQRVERALRGDDVDEVRSCIKLSVGEQQQKLLARLRQLCLRGDDVDEVRSCIKLSVGEEQQKLLARFRQLCSEDGPEQPKGGEARALRAMLAVVCMSADGGSLYVETKDEGDWPVVKRFVETQLRPKLRKAAANTNVLLPSVVQVRNGLPQYEFERSHISVEVIDVQGRQEVVITSHDYAGNPIPDSVYRYKGNIR